MQEYSTTFMINKPAEEVFKAISHELSHWWGKQSQPIEANGTLFTVSWGAPWYKFKVIEYQPDRLLVWECIDANQIIDGLEGVAKEWVGSKIHWQLYDTGGNTTALHFRHEGLTPSLLCFDFCSSTWNHFLNDSLVTYLMAK